MTNNHGSRSDSRASTRIERGLEERATLWGKLLNLPLLWAMLAVVTCSLMLMPRLGRHLPQWEPGEVASADVVMPFDITLPDEAATEAVRAEARAAVLPVYDLEPRLQVELTEGVWKLFGLCRAGVQGEDLAASSDLRIDESMLKVLESSACDPALERALAEVIVQIDSTRVVDDLRALERRGAQGVTLRNLEIGTERTVNLGDLSGAVDVKTGLESALRARLLEQDAVARRWIKPAHEFLEANSGPNLVYSRGETEQRMRAAADGVPPVSQVFRRGQVLVRRGDSVTYNVARTLQLLNRQREDTTKYLKAVGLVLLVTMIAVGWWKIQGRFVGPSGGWQELSTIYLLMILFVGMNKLGVFVASAIATSGAGGSSAVGVYLWALPYAAGPITVFVLLGMQPAVLFAVFTALTGAILEGGNFDVVIFALSAGLVGVLALQRFSDRTRLSRVGVAVGVANVAVGGIVALYRGLPEMPATMAMSAGVAFVGGPLAIVVASSLLPVLEWMFGITTDMRLLELSNQNLPLLKQLSLEAPGTYQHSLAVGNLAEAGADAVGGNALLLRVCAYYHDVGKVLKPDYFVENQRGANPHDSLSPSMSALVIQSHVKEGLEMARKAKLPLPIRQGIATHHGTKLIRYFYNKAIEQTKPGLSEVRDSDYRYPGPKPHTKELGILLLADAVEAAARTLDTTTPDKIQAMMNKIFTDALEDGQLDSCDLTFSQLDKVASAFLWVLTNMYHHRIDYPGFDFNRRQKKRDTGPLQVGSKAVAAGE